MSTSGAEVHRFPNAKTTPPAKNAEGPALEAPSAPVEAAAPEKTDTPKKKRSARSLLLPIIALVLLAAGGWYGYNYWVDGRFMISTDDAYVQADMAFISPKISGYVEEVKVGENQPVKVGDPLFVIDQGDYRIAVAQAEDLAGERVGVNLPGTDRQRPNWRQRLATPVEALFQSPRARAILRGMAER